MANARSANLKKLESALCHMELVQVAQVNCLRQTLKYGIATIVERYLNCLKIRITKRLQI